MNRTRHGAAQAAARERPRVVASRTLPDAAYA